MARVHVETSITDYLTARSREDVIVQVRHELTRIWWNARRGQYKTVV